MARQAIDLTTVQANGKKGESAISAFTKINSMTSELYQAYFKSNIVGTVSQSSGVPTGAIVERGSNANGEYVRFADGTQICWSPIITSTVSVTTAAAGGYRGTQADWTFPAGFSSVPDVFHNSRSSTHLQGELRSLSATLMAPSAWSATSSTSVSCAYQAIATGRWF